MVAAIVAEREVTSVPTTGLKITPAVMVSGMAGTARTCGRAKGRDCRRGSLEVCLVQNDVVRRRFPDKDRGPRLMCGRFIVAGVPT